MKKVILMVLMLASITLADKLEVKELYLEDDSSGIPILYTHTSEYLYVSYDGFDIRCKEVKGKVRCQELVTPGNKWVISDMSDYSDDLMYVIKDNIHNVGR